MVVIPILIMWRLTRAGGSRWLTAGLLALLVVAMARTQASGAWLGLLAAAGYLVIAEPVARRSLLVAVGVLGGIALVLASRGEPGLASETPPARAAADAAGEASR